jgi:hypothetical protein
MSFYEVMKRLSLALQTAGVPYMLTGSFASVFYGLPRSTQDIDIVIAPSPATLRTLLQSLPPDEYYTETEAAFEALGRESLFNIIDLKTGWKIDLIICKSRAFSLEEFGRRHLAQFEDVSLFVASAEDVILAKLEWAKLGQSLRQIEDAAGILKMRSGSLDLVYIDKWIRDLDLEQQWGDARRTSGVDDNRPSPKANT